MPMNLNDDAISGIKGAEYCGIISGICKNETINVMQNVFLVERKENIIKHFHIFKYYQI